MEAPIFQKSVDEAGFIIRPFSDFLVYLRSHITPKGAVVLFKEIPKGWEEVTDITAPTGYKYGKKL